MNDEQIRTIIRDELSNIIKLDRYVFDKNIQILDGNNIQVGRTIGMTIGTGTDQKIGFHGKKTIQAAAIADPTGGVTVDGQARGVINSILTVLRNFGIIAT